MAVFGRKAFCTLKLYQGVPARRITPATAHRPAAAFKHLLTKSFYRVSERASWLKAFLAWAEDGLDRPRHRHCRKCTVT